MRVAPTTGRGPYSQICRGFAALMTRAASLIVPQWCYGRARRWMKPQPEAVHVKVQLLSETSGGLAHWA
jgi:hypothetical protein